jgi:exosortase
LCFLAACAPLVLAHARQLWLRPHYQFFPLLLIGAVVLAWSRLRSVPIVPDASLSGAALAGLTWALLAGAVLLDSSWLGMVATLIGLAAVIIGAGGRALFRQLLPAWALLWLAVPLPFEYDRTVVLFLQTLTTWCSSDLLDLFGVFHAVSGHVIEVSGRRLLVEQACGGVNSLLSVLACTLFFVFLVRRPPLRAALLVLSALAWVLAANVARVVLVVLLYARRGIDLTAGWRHDALGLFLFSLALGLIWSTDRLLAFLAGPVRSQPPADQEAPAEARSTPEPGMRWTWLSSWPFGVAFALLAAAWAALHGSAADPFAAPQRPLPVLGRVSAETMPGQVGDCRRTGFAEQARGSGSEFGENSRAWAYRVGPAEGVLSLDYPFPGWHDLTRCYTTQGWVIQEETVVSTPDAGHGETGYVRIRLTKPGYRSGYLLFCQFDGRGTVLEPRCSGTELTWHRQAAAVRRLWRTSNGTADPGGDDPPGPVYQLQLFVESYGPLSARDEKQAEALFRAAVREVRP